MTQNTIDINQIEQEIEEDIQNGFIENYGILLKEKTPEIIIGSLGFVAALTWNDAIKDTINTYVPKESKQHIAMRFAITLVITFIILLIILLIISLSNVELPDSMKERAEGFTSKIPNKSTKLTKNKRNVRKDNFNTLSPSNTIRYPRSFFQGSTRTASEQVVQELRPQTVQQDVYGNWYARYPTYDTNTSNY